MIVFPDFILKATAFQIFIETFVTWYMSEFFRYDHILWDILTIYYRSNVRQLISGNPATDLRQVKSIVRMLIRILIKSLYRFFQICQVNAVPVLIKCWDSIRLSLYSFGVSHFGTKILQCHICSTACMVSIKI